jgi:Na+-translocating ferredoxin:NAD+ oxidoreductase RnfC subunit
MEKLGLSSYLEWKPEGFTDVCEEITRVRVYLQHSITPACKPSIPTVEVGEQVKRGQLIAKPLDGPIEEFKNLSIAQHASIDGVVKEVTEEYILIERDGTARVS